jgi:hypothetical protein
MSSGCRIFVLSAVLIVGVAVGLHAYRYRDEFVFLTVEESSMTALAGLPIGWEKLPGAFIDCEDKSIELDRRPHLFGVSLGVHFVSSSRGIEFAESLRFSRLGRVSVGIGEPVSVQGLDWSGNKVEMVDNSARVVRGELVVEKTESPGVVHLRYGGRRFSLSPGQSWAELLTSSDGEITEIPAGSWEEEVDACLAEGRPVTRLAIANRGFWPKSNVREYMPDPSGGVTR